MLLTKESLFDEKQYSKNNFFNDILNTAVTSELITEEQCIKYQTNMANVLMEHAYSVTSEVEINIEESIKLVVENHLYLVSLYLFHNFKPSQALFEIRDTSAMRLHAKAVKYYESSISDKYLELKEFEKKVNTSKEAGKRECYRNVLKLFNLALLYDTNMLDLTTAQEIWSFDQTSYMSSSDFDFNDIINSLLLIADSFMIEFSMRNKFKKDVIKKIKNEYYTKYKCALQGRINNEIREKEEEIKKKLKYEFDCKRESLKDDPNYKILFGDPEQEYKAELEYALEQLESEKDEKMLDVASMYELENILVNVLAELACVTISIAYPRFIIPSTIEKKYESLRKVPDDILFEELFAHEEIVIFDEKEKKYLKKYLKNNFVTID